MLLLLDLLLLLDWASEPLLDWLDGLLGLRLQLLLRCRLLLLQVRVWYLALCSNRRGLSADHASTHLVHALASYRHGDSPLHGYLTHIHLLLDEFLRENLDDFHLECEAESHVCEWYQILHLPVVHKQCQVDRDVFDVHVWGHLGLCAEYLNLQVRLEEPPLRVLGHLEHPGDVLIRESDSRVIWGPAPHIF